MRGGSRRYFFSCEVRRNHPSSRAAGEASHTSSVTGIWKGGYMREPRSNSGRWGLDTRSSDEAISTASTSSTSNALRLVETSTDLVTMGP